MAHLNWSLAALDWLKEIHDYIAQDNPRAADGVIDGILGKVDLLTRFPDIGSRLRVVPEGEVRILLYGHYRIAYLRRTDASTVDVLGVFHDALDIDRYIP